MDCVGDVGLYAAVGILSVSVEGSGGVCAISSVGLDFWKIQNQFSLLGVGVSAIGEWVAGRLDSPLFVESIVRVLVKIFGETWVQFLELLLEG